MAGPSEGIGTVTNADLPAVIFTTGGVIVSTLQITSMRLEGDVIIYEMVDGSTLHDPQPYGTGQTAFDTIANALHG